MSQFQWMVPSIVGDLYLVASEKGLKGIFWKEQPVPRPESLQESDHAVKVLALAVRELTAYFAGQLRSFTVTLDVAGTPFQKEVWQQLQKIPYGQTCSYKDIASGIKNPKAVRAVGSANGRNPLAIIIPCHRVIAADGTLGGYSGGLDIKTKLLSLEQSVHH